MARRRQEAAPAIPVPTSGGFPYVVRRRRLRTCHACGQDPADGLMYVSEPSAAPACLACARHTFDPARDRFVGARVRGVPQV